MRSIGFRVNFVHHDVNMKMLLVVVSDDHVLVFLEAELVQCVQGGVGPRCPRWPLTWRPCEFVMDNRIVAAWVEELKCFHLGGRCVDADEVVRQYDISSKQGIAGIRVAFLCEVVQQSLETTLGLPLARLDFGNHIRPSGR